MQIEIPGRQVLTAENGPIGPLRIETDDTDLTLQSNGMLGGIETRKLTSPTFSMRIYQRLRSAENLRVSWIAR